MTNKQNVEIPEFETVEQALDHMNKVVDDPCIDNFRFAFIDEDQGTYLAIRKSGCCGFYDIQVKVGGRLANIGCNYGH